MERWMLAVGYDIEQFNETQRECLNYGVFIRMVADSSEAIRELTKNRYYLLVAIFSDTQDYLSALKIIHGLTKAPILVMKHQYDGAEKIAAIEAGADEYIQWPDTIQEGLASARALIRRYTKMNQVESDPLTTLTYGDIFLCVEYHKVFICGREAIFTRQEFEFLRLLLSGIGRAFTHDQICEAVWGVEYSERSSNALWCLVSKVRGKIAALGGDNKVIQTVRDVGYRIE